MRVVEAVARRGCCHGVDAVCSSLEWLQLLLLNAVATTSKAESLDSKGGFKNLWVPMGRGEWQWYTIHLSRNEKPDQMIQKPSDSFTGN